MADGLIWRGVVLNAMKVYGYGMTDAVLYQMRMEEYIKQLPAVDAVPVVRCGYCKYFERQNVQESIPQGWRFHWEYGCKKVRTQTGRWYEVRPDGFCSDGKHRDRKDGDANGRS